MQNRDKSLAQSFSVENHINKYNNTSHLIHLLTFLTFGGSYKSRFLSESF